MAMKIKFSGLVLTLALVGCGADEPPKSTEAPKPAEAVPAQPTAPVQTKADYPQELIGKWADGSGDKACKKALKAEKQTGMWDGLVIEKEGLYSMAGSCTATNVTSSGDSFTINEDCASEGDEFKVSSEYKVLGSTLKVATDDGSGKKNLFTYTSCKAPVTCTVNPGQAGVTTFMDEKLTKAAPNPIRDFDGYTFKSDKTIVVDKTNVLVGKLYTSDGRPSKGSYAIADEWTCK
jgi:hypothetical protein